MHIKVNLETVCVGLQERVGELMFSRKMHVVFKRKRSSARRQECEGVYANTLGF